MSELRISHSALIDYLQCRYRYYLSYVLRLRGPKALPPAAGAAIHSGIEAFYKGSQSPVDALRADWDREVALVDPAEVAADPGAFSDAVKMLATYAAKAPRVEPALIEAPFLFRLDGVLLSGTIDLADSEDNVIDHKLRWPAPGKKSSTFNPEKHRIQMATYALGFRSLTGRAARKLLLNVLSRAGRFKQYKVQPDYAGLTEVVRITSSGISQGDYKPTGASNGSCHWCDFRNMCDFSTARDT